MTSESPASFVLIQCPRTKYLEHGSTLIVKKVHAQLEAHQMALKWHHGCCHVWPRNVQQIPSFKARMTNSQMQGVTTRLTSCKCGVAKSRC